MKYIKKFENNLQKELDVELTEYVRQTNIKGIRKSIQNGANIDNKNSVGNTPIMVATILSNYKSADYLIDNDCNLNIQNQRGQTPLIKITSSTKFQKIQFDFDMLCKLIDAHADWNIKDNQNKTFLDYLNTDNFNLIIQKYPEKYQDYLIKENSEKYNL